MVVSLLSDMCVELRAHWLLIGQKLNDLQVIDSSLLHFIAHSDGVITFAYTLSSLPVKAMPGNFL